VIKVVLFEVLKGSATAAMSKVALVWPALMVTSAGTVAAPVFVLTKLTTRLDERTAGIPTVPIAAFAPALSATELVDSTSASAGTVTDPLAVNEEVASPPLIPIISAL
jgi:hypothetical protein